MINNSNFLVKEIPSFHPITQKYDRLEFWREQKRRCIEGYWSGGKWMPPELYYYVNFHTITYEDGAFRGTGRPWLRDVEWEKAYVYAEATGFSGFELDEEYTCHRWYGPEKERALKYGWITEDDLGKKKYIPAREYLRKVHRRNLGKPIYLNESKHIIDLECFAEDTMVLMYDGSSKAIQDIEVGDVVMGPDSKPRNVISRHNGEDDLYEIKSKRFDPYVCNSKHEVALFVRDRINGKYKNGKRSPGHYETRYDNIKVDELLKKQEQSSFTNRFYLYQSDSIEFDNVNDPKIDPYFLGYWLSDGRSNTVSVKPVDGSILDNLTYGNVSLEIHKASGNRKKSFELKWRKKDNPELYELFRPMLYDKHIPYEYKTSSTSYRLELLAGIIDGDGCYDRAANSFDVYAGLNETLANDIAFVARSCGFYSNVTKRTRDGYSDTYEVIISGDIWKIPTKYERKQAVKVNRRIDVKKSSFEIIPKGKGEFFGIEVDGDNLFLLNNFVVVHNSRGGGKSFWSSGCIMHNFLFDGARDYDEYLAKRQAGNALKSEGIVGAINAIYSNDLLAKVKTAFEFLPDRQIINTGRENEVFPSPLAVDFTGSLAPSRFIISKISGSILHHRTFGDNPLAANATRPNRVWLDEVGFMDNIKAAWEGIEATQASAQFKRLTIHAMGTGGLTQGGAALYTQEMFYDPESYGALVFEDEWENKGHIGYFLSAEYTLNRFKEGPNYITNKDLALDYIMEEREIAGKANSASKYMGTIINKPIVPSEIFLRAEGSYFQQQMAKLKDRLGYLEASNSLLQASYKYDFDLINNKVKPIISRKKPIREFPLPKGATMDAPVELFELPRKNAAGEVPYNRYIAGWDPVSSDGNEDTERSLQSMFIFDTWTDRIVAEYTARTYLYEDYYEQARRLLIFYNARCNYEKNIKGPYAYFKNKNSLHLLIETPDILKDMSLATSKPTVGNNSLGTQTSQGITNWGLSLIKSWLASDAYGGEGINIDRLMSPALIKELISYNPDINVDRIMALIMVMIYREDMIKIIDIAKDTSIKSKSKDKFWDRAFNKTPNRGIYSLSQSL